METEQYIVEQKWVIEEINGEAENLYNLMKIRIQSTKNFGRKKRQ
jgi:hypothetical protein